MFGTPKQPVMQATPAPPSLPPIDDPQKGVDAQAKAEAEKRKKQAMKQREELNPTGSGLNVADDLAASNAGSSRASRAGVRRSALKF